MYGAVFIAQQLLRLKEGGLRSLQHQGRLTGFPARAGQQDGGHLFKCLHENVCDVAAFSLGGFEGSGKFLAVDA